MSQNHEPPRVEMHDLTHTRPVVDKKLYRCCVLPNGLEVLLVNAPKPTGSAVGVFNAAAALAVEVGSFADPLEAQGLAHFLEHMVFMGSDKYPQENEYDQFITMHGGECNAWTDCEYTMYHFTVISEMLAPALDRFAHCLMRPLLRWDACDREVNAIESEFQLSSTSDGCRMQQLWCHCATPSHPFHKFSWGNLKSLKTIPEEKGVDMRALLRAFHSVHYVAPRMRLCVYGKQCLDELQQMVEESFGALPTSWQEREQTLSTSNEAIEAVTAVPSSHATKPFGSDGETNMCLYRIRPVKRIHRLCVSWALFPLIAEYKSKPSAYIEHLIGHEGDGSLLSFLKAQGLATGIYAGVGNDGYDNNKCCAVLLVEIELTLKGVVQWIHVVDALFGYISLLRNQEPAKWIFDEMQLMAKKDYDHLDDEEPDEFASRLSLGMLPMYQRKREHYINGDYLLFEFSASRVQALLADMIVRSARIDIMSAAYGRAGLQTEDGAENSLNDSRDADAGDSGVEESEDDDDEDEDEAYSKEDDDEDDYEHGDEEEDEEGEPDSPQSSGRNGKRLTQQQIIVERFIKYVEELPEAHASFIDLILPPEVTGLMREPNFGTEYWVNTVPEVLLQRWESVTCPSEMCLPPRNKFLPEDLSLRWDPAAEQLNPARPSPALVADDDGFKMWHTMDKRFPLPRAEVCLRLCLSRAAESPLTQCTLDLIAQLLNDATQEIAYMATMAELHFAAKATDVALILRFSGFNHKLSELCLSIVKTLTDFDVLTEPDRCSVQRESLERVLTNHTNKIGKQASTLRLQCLKPSRYKAEAKLEALHSLTNETARSLIRDMLSKMYVEGLIYGNYSTDEALYLSEQLKATLTQSLGQGFGLSAEGAIPVQPRIFSHLHLPPQQIVGLQKGCIIVLESTSTSAAESNNAIELYFQVGPWDLRRACQLDLLEQLMTEPLFNRVRTQLQLCYSVSCGCRETYGVLGFVIAVQSCTHSCTSVLKHVIEFLQQFHQMLSEIPEADFSQHKATLAATKLQQSLTLSDSAQCAWDEVLARRYRWHLCEEEASTLSSITRDEVRELFTQLCSPSPTAAMLCVHVTGQASSITSDTVTLQQALGFASRPVRVITRAQEAHSSSELLPVLV